MTLLQIKSLRLNIGAKTICRDLNLAVNPGQCVGVLGINGVGKTSLLYCLVNLRRAQSGSILLQEQEIAGLPPVQLAQRCGLLFQESASYLPATVLESVLLGRHPHTQSLLRDHPDDIALARRIIAEVGLAGLEDRQMQSLSGGERQRVAIALLLVQAPALMLLDEPSNHLDIDSQMKLLRLIRAEARQRNGGILMATHDINLAQRFCDAVLLMSPDGEYLFGSTDEVLTAANLSSAYNCRIDVIEHAAGRFYYPA